MKKLKINKKNFNNIESFRANCTCVCKCGCKNRKLSSDIDSGNYKSAYSKFYERGAGVY